MQIRRMATVVTIVTIVAVLTFLLATTSIVAGPQDRLAADNPNPPAFPVKLIFIHHSTGGNWLADPNQDQPYGGLGTALMNNNYYVSATNYGWGPYGIGDRTDIPNWPEWFTGPNSSDILSALYAENGQNFGEFGSWSRLATDPGGENEIIMFKACFPNSDLYGNPDDPPASEPNDQFTVSNAKAVYNNLLTYFATRLDKLFVAITAPPMGEGEYSQDVQTPAQRAANARAFNNWLVNDWLDGYPYHNVAVFDYYNILTSNGSTTRVDDPGTNEEPNDAGWADGNHHRWWDGAVQHIQTIGNNYSAYPTDTDWDSHPTTDGHQKATSEFAQLLNVFYNRWAGGAVTPTPTTTGPSSTATPTASATPISPDLPDLIVNSMKIELETGGACDYVSTQLGVRVWVENIDSGDAGPFVVDVNGAHQSMGSGLPAGQITSAWLAGAYVWPDENTAFADATFLVEESNEDNNQLTQLLPMPTLPPTCTPMSTPTSTPTPTGTAMPPTYRFVYLPLILKNWTAPVPTPTPTPTAVTPAGLIQPSDLVYQGAFRLPDDAARP